MNLTKRNSLSRLTNYRGGAGEEHPLPAHGAGAVTIAAACTSGGNALALTLSMLLLCGLMGFVYIFERGEYLQPMRTLVYLIPSALLTCLCGLIVNALSPAVAQSVGMYLPLLSVDALVLARLQPDAPFIPPTQALPEALRLWWLYAVTALPVGLLREWLSGGTVFGARLLFSLNMDGMALTGTGFLLLGFALAIARKRQDS